MTDPKHTTPPGDGLTDVMKLPVSDVQCDSPAFDEEHSTFDSMTREGVTASGDMPSISTLMASNGGFMGGEGYVEFLRLAVSTDGKLLMSGRVVLVDASDFGRAMGDVVNMFARQYLEDYVSAGDAAVFDAVLGEIMDGFDETSGTTDHIRPPELGEHPGAYLARVLPDLPWAALTRDEFEWLPPFLAGEATLTAAQAVALEHLTTVPCLLLLELQVQHLSGKAGLLDRPAGSA